MSNYLQYVYNLQGETNFRNLNKNAKELVYSYYKQGIQDQNELEKVIIHETGSQIFEFISKHIDLKRDYQNTIFSTTYRSYLNNIDFDNISSIISTRPVNDIRYINEHFRSVNKLLPDSGILVGCTETYFLRKKRFFRTYGRSLGKVVWICDFFLTRVIPRISFLEPIYYFFTKGKNHTVSHAETLGRLVYCGFEILDTTQDNNLMYFVAKKIKDPSNDKNPTLRPIVKLDRIGKGGNVIKVYKFRTMHPYSEYLQEYVVRRHGYNDVGKPAYDFRVTRWGKWMRKLWLDEIPQIINVFKGEMVLVGVRPLSSYRFGEFPKDLRQERIKHKPGCFPPYVALCMPDDKENIEAERIYLRDKEKHPHTTNLKYFIKAVYNITFNKIRSS